MKNKKCTPEYLSAYMKNRNQKLKECIYSLLGNKCRICGFLDYRALQIDHINGGGIQERNSRNGSHDRAFVLKSILNKENKYQLLCANCNWIKRFENKEHGRGNSRK